MFLKRFSQNKYNRKEGNHSEKPSTGGDMSGIVSTRSSNGRIYCLRRKYEFVPKSKELKKTFSFGS